jgi:hypothetical protein
MTAPRFPVAKTGDGTTKTFALGFPVISEKHVRVTVGDVLKTQGTDYTISDATATEKSGYPQVNFVAAPANSAAIKFYRNTPLKPEAKTLVIGQQLELYAQYRAEEDHDHLVNVDLDCNQTDVLAGTAATFIAPCDGYIASLRTEVTAAVGTGGDVTVLVAGSAVTGLTNTIANSAAVGSIVSDTPTTAQDASTQVRKGQVVSVVPASAFASTGSYTARVSIQPADLG